MIIATFNVNGVNGRLPILLRWLDESKPDIVCLQELKAPDERFPAAALAQAGYGAVWHGQKAYNGVAILARGCKPRELRRGLPGDPDDDASRYLEAEVAGLTIGCLYLPNGNPAPGPAGPHALPGTAGAGTSRRAPSRRGSRASRFASECLPLASRPASVPCGQPSCSPCCDRPGSVTRPS